MLRRNFMPLVILKELLCNAKKGNYAVGAFNINGLEDAQGMVNGAIAKRSPVILMVGKGTLNFIGLHQVVGIAKAADVPVCLHLDHATDVEIIKEAIKAGFSSVMIDASLKDYETNLRLSKSIVQFSKNYHWPTTPAFAVSLCAPVISSGRRRRLIQTRASGYHVKGAV
jgi:fructose/tagatose bisphosphate aldolase